MLKMYEAELDTVDRSSLQQSHQMYTECEKFAHIIFTASVNWCKTRFGPEMTLSKEYGLLCT